MLWGNWDARKIVSPSRIEKCGQIKADRPQIKHDGSGRFKRECGGWRRKFVVCGFLKNKFATKKGFFKIMAATSGHARNVRSHHASMLNAGVASPFTSGERPAFYTTPSAATPLLLCGDVTCWFESSVDPPASEPVGWFSALGMVACPDGDRSVSVCPVHHPFVGGSSTCLVPPLPTFLRMGVSDCSRDGYA
jgi:hypothetical protein